MAESVPIEDRTDCELATQPCDLRIRGNEAEADVLAKITELLKAKSVMS